MRAFERQPLSAEPLWRLRQRHQELRCEIGEADGEPEMRLLLDGRKLLGYQGVSRRSLRELASKERAELEAQGWRSHPVAV